MLATVTPTYHAGDWDYDGYDDETGEWIGDPYDSYYDTTYDTGTSGSDDLTDSDGDNYSDWEEILAGTDPDDPSSYPGSTGDSASYDPAWDESSWVDDSSSYDPAMDFYEDTDGDGLTDDEDGDGLTALQEWIYGTSDNVSGDQTSQRDLLLNYLEQSLTSPFSNNDESDAHLEFLRNTASILKKRSGTAWAAPRPIATSHDVVDGVPVFDARRAGHGESWSRQEILSRNVA
jgi:hypothetical protein